MPSCARARTRENETRKDTRFLRFPFCVGRPSEPPNYLDGRKRDPDSDGGGGCGNAYARAPASTNSVTSTRTSSSSWSTRSSATPSVSSRSANCSSDPKGSQAMLHGSTSEGGLGTNENAKGNDDTAEMIGIDSDDDSEFRKRLHSESVDIGSTKFEINTNDYLVGSTGVQLTEIASYEMPPGTPYFQWYSRRGQYNMCGDEACACTEVRDGDGQPWCGKPDLSFAPCCRDDCPCPASWNGQEGQYCGRTCQRNGACSTDRHVTPSGAASTRNLVRRRFVVIGRVRCHGPFVYTVRWDDDPGQTFITELHPRMFIPWPKNLPCPVPSSHPTRYEWTLDTIGVEDVTVPEELVELVARTHGYVIVATIHHLT